MRKRRQAPPVQWLYSGSGAPVAFRWEGAAYDIDGRFLGIIDGDQVVDSQYVGHIVGDRLVRLIIRPHVDMKHRKRDDTDFVPSPPREAGPVELPIVFQDIELSALRLH